MKTLLAVVSSLAVGLSVWAQSELALPTDSAANISAADAVKLPMEKMAAEKSGPKKGSEPAAKEEPKIKGVVVDRGERGFLGVEIVESAFRISFYDTNKKPKNVDVSRAVLRWDAKYKVGQERLVLNPTGDGKALTSPKPIRPPYTFKLYITLVKEATEKEDAVGETHVIDFRA